MTIVCFVVVSLFLRHTTLGRDIYASGGHRKAAIQSDAPVGKTLTGGFVISGGLSALGGGIGSPLGVAMGVLILTMLNNGLGLLNATSTQIVLVNGLSLLVVVLLDGHLGAVLTSPLERFAKKKVTGAV
ncbi:hypothetical protein PQQ87_12255 [Paraburkholderia nemoris]